MHNKYSFDSQPWIKLQLYEANGLVHFSNEWKAIELIGKGIFNAYALRKENEIKIKINKENSKK